MKLIKNNFQVVAVTKKSTNLFLKTKQQGYSVDVAALTPNYHKEVVEINPKGKILIKPKNEIHWDKLINYKRMVLIKANF